MLRDKFQAHVQFGMENDRILQQGINFRQTKKQSQKNHQLDNLEESVSGQKDQAEDRQRRAPLMNQARFELQAIQPQIQGQFKSLLYQQLGKMNYFFTPFAIVNQYQPYYGFLPQMLVQSKAYYIQEPPFQKQIAAQQCSQASFERQFVSKPIDSPIDCHKKHPKLKKKEDKNFGFRQQDKERNIFSNILKGFFIALTQKRTMDTFLDSLLLKYANGMDIEQFLLNVSQIFSKCKSYFSPKSVRQILRLEEGHEIIKNIVQKCLYKYLKTEFSLSLLLSKRIKRKSKLLQMRKSRELVSILRGSE